ncbi:MAG: serine/threonine-protein kinase, partial [Anaerolineales bacterium]
MTMEPAADLLADPAAEHGEYFADGHRFGRFAIREFLCATGASAAYRAREMGAAREAVLKVYTPRFSGVPGLANYVRTVAQRDHADLAHPNLAQFFRAGVSASRIFIARAYTAGGSAQDRLNAGESFSVPEVLAIVRDLAQALHYLHARGVVHRNIKPSNILFGDDGRAMLADAGLRPLLEAANQTYLASGVLLQSRAYQAQEQLAAKGATPQSDIFSLAASLYTLLTRMPPFEAEEPRALLEEQLVGAPPSARRHVPAVPAEMDALLQRAMDFAPGRRPQSIKAFATELGIEIGAPAAVVPVVETEGPGNEEKIAIRGRPPKKLPERAHAPRVRIGDQFARLTIRSRIAFTPIATIFRASDSADKRQVVFKILGPD